MLEYFTYKKYKKNKEEKEKTKASQKPESPAAEVAATSTKPAIATQLKEKPAEHEKHEKHEKPVLDDNEQSWFERLTSGQVSVEDLPDEDEGPKPTLPPRVKTPDLSWDSDSESFVKQSLDDKGKGKAAATTGDSSKKGPSAAEKLGRRISVLVRRGPKKDVKPTNLAVPEPEADKEKDDLSRVLDDLNLSAKNNRAFNLSAESADLVAKFTVVLKDLVNGVPTAVDDLKSLMDTEDGAFQKNFEKLPGSIKKLVESLPGKLGSTLAPEILLAAAESQGISAQDKSKAGMKSTAKSMLTPKNLAELVTKPSAIISMLKAIMNALKVRWPAFIGTNVIWSVALFSKSLAPLVSHALQPS
jgi:hypothetical protein